MPHVPRFRELFRTPSFYGALATVALGGFVIFLAVWLIVHVEPECHDSPGTATTPGWECFQSESEQNAYSIMFIVTMILAPGVLISVGGVRWSRIVMGDWRWQEWQERARLARRAMPDTYESLAHELVGLRALADWDTERAERDDPGGKAEAVRIGRVLYSDGGVELMLDVYLRVAHLQRAQGPRIELGTLERAWRGIGEWDGPPTRASASLWV